MLIAGFEPNSFVDFPKNISAVVFFAGCNMRCWYCHNEQILDIKKIDKNLLIDEDYIFAELEKKKNFLDGVVITGGEPLIQDGIFEFIQKVKDMGYLIKLDTNGLSPKLLERAINSKNIDYLAMDIKAPLEKYSLLVSEKTDAVMNLRSSIKLIINSGIDYEFRTTVIPALTSADIVAMAEEIQGAKNYFLQQYNEKKGIKPLDKDKLIEYRDVASKLVECRIRGI